MLIEFSVTNFRSIRDKVTLSMVADKSVSKKNELPDNLIEVDKNLHLLKSIVMYGRNASGKSNIIDAFFTLSLLVSSSQNRKLGEATVFYYPFRFDAECRKKPTEFEISFLLPSPEENIKIKYIYRISIDFSRVLHESLYFYPKGQRAKLFERDYGKEITYGDSLKGNKKNIEEGLLENQLFLSKSSIFKNASLNEVYQFIATNVSILNNHNFSEKREDLFKEEILPPLYEENLNWKKNLLELLKAADTGIVDIFYSQNYKTFYTKHESSSSNLSEDFKSFLLLVEESIGTQKLIVISTIIFSKLETGGAIIIDELDKSLHPLLTKMIIQIFHSKKNNPNNAQLIFATHDSSLMNGELFRRDQMFITEKDETGKTNIKTLASIKGVRKDIPFEKWYLNGSFGGIPVIYEPEFEFNADKPVK